MALKPIYQFDGKRWMPIGRAAALLVTNTATVKKMMGDGRLEWGQLPRGKTLLVEEESVLRQRRERGAAMKQTARRAAEATRTADARGASMRRVAAASERLHPLRGPGVFDRTWDPLPLPLPVSGRDPDKRDKP